MPPNTAPWTFHDLRGTFASGCAKLGVAVHVVEAALNHRSGTIKGVAAVYNRYSYDTKSAQHWLSARYVEAIVAGGAAGRTNGGESMMVSAAIGRRQGRPDWNLLTDDDRYLPAI